MSSAVEPGLDGPDVPVLVVPKERGEWSGMARDALGYFETKATIRCVGCGHALSSGTFVLTVGHSMPTSAHESRRIAFFCRNCERKVSEAAKP